MTLHFFLGHDHDWPRDAFTGAGSLVWPRRHKGDAMCHAPGVPVAAGGGGASNSCSADTVTPILDSRRVWDHIKATKTHFQFKIQAVYFRYVGLGLAQ